MDPAWILLAKIVATFVLLALIVYGCSRAVRWAKKGGVGGELVGTALMFFSFGGALSPVKEVAAERRKLKRSEEGSGDPDPGEEEGSYVTQPQMKRLSIRPAAMEDAEAIAILTVELGYPTTVSATKSRLRALLAAPDYFIAVAEADGRVVGWVAGEVRTSLEFEPRVEIVGLVVAPTHRRNGIGKALVGSVEAWQSERGIPTIFVRSNITRPDSHPFYESAGYSLHKTQHAYIKHAG